MSCLFTQLVYVASYKARENEWSERERAKEKTQSRGVLDLWNVSQYGELGIPLA